MQRTGQQSDRNIPLTAKMIVLPFILLLNATMTFFWIIVILSTTDIFLFFIFLFSNWLMTLSCIMITRKICKSCSYEEAGNEHENPKLMLTTVITSWISPLSVWSNYHKSARLSLLLTNITNIIFMYATVGLLVPYNKTTILYTDGFFIISVLAAIILCCSIPLQILGNPHNIYKVSKYCCCCIKPIVSRVMIYDFLDDPSAFLRGHFMLLQIKKPYKILKVHSNSN